MGKVRGSNIIKVTVGEGDREQSITTERISFPPLNEKTREVGRFIFDYMSESVGRAPTIREIGAAVKGAWSKDTMSVSIVWGHLRTLEQAGIITIKYDGLKRSRAISIVGAMYIVPKMPKVLEANEVKEDE